MREICIIFIIFCNSLLYAQQLKVSVDKNPAIVGEQILIQYTINEEGDNFVSPNFNGLKVISGPNPSKQSSYSFVNGKSQSTSSTTYSFYIKALKEGKYNITPASITINSKKINSSSYQLNIVKGNERSKTQQKELTKNLFIKVDVSKKNIVVGEQILVSYKLFTRIDLQNTELSKLPNLNGFWAKELETSSRFKRDVIDGVPYNTATIKKSVLTAQKSGKLIIDPLELKCSIRLQNKRNTRDPFASFFGSGYNIKDEFISSKAITINVSDLPDPPPTYNGAVGQMKISSEVDNTNTNANNAITYKLKITGTGNIELIEPLKINFPDDFEVYDPKVSEKIFEGGRKRSTKTFEYLLIPRYKGEYTIPPASLTVYNTKDKKFKTQKTNTHKLTISENNNSEEELNTNQQVIRTEKKDINFIFSESDFIKKDNIIISKGKFLMLFFLPIILLIILLFYNKLIDNNSENKNKWKNRKANKIALKRLNYAQICIKNDNFDLFFEEIEKSLWGYFADKFQVPSAELSKETVSIYFRNQGIPKITKERFIDLINECQFARYAPTSNRNTKMEETLNKAKEIIIEVENTLK